MKITKIILIIIGLLFIGTLVFGGIFYYQNLRGIGPAISKPPADIRQELPVAVIATSSTINIQPDNGPLTLPLGFAISIWATDLPGARVMVFDQEENTLWVSQTGRGLITKINIKEGKVQNQEVVFSGLKNPHGLAFDPENFNILYLAEETKISKVDVSGIVRNMQKIIDLPQGGLHFTRTINFGTDGRLYVAIGSTCNVCDETDPHYASIWSLNKDGIDFKEVAKGLRNSVFFTWNKLDGKLWATTMGRDFLGDDLPPDTINVIDTNNTSTLWNFGWPICYGKNIHDANFDKRVYVRNPCSSPQVQGSRIDLPAHSAPLGLVFVSTSYGWPAEYSNNLLVAYHGSWNRNVPTGYKIVRIILDDKQNFVRQEDFVAGWLTLAGALGRPVDLVFDKSGALYVSDDKAGVIYKVEYQPQA